MDTNLNKSFKLLSYGLTAIWTWIIVTGVVLFCQLRGHNPLGGGDMLSAGKNMLGWQIVSFVISIASVIFTTAVAKRFWKQLTDYDVRGGKKLFFGITSLFIPVLCTGSIFGGNIATGLVFSDSSGPATALSILSLIIFTLFPTLSYWGLCRIATPAYPDSRGIPSLSVVKLSSLVLMVVSLLLSPLLLTLINANIKIENPTAINIIAAVVYAGAVGFFIYSLFNVKYIEVMEAEKEEFEEMQPDTHKVLSQTGQAYMYVWFAIVLSAVVMFLYYHFPNVVFLILSYVVYAGSLVAVWFGLKTGIKLKKTLQIKGTWLVTASFVVLAVTSLLSLNSIFGANYILKTPFETSTTIKRESPNNQLDSWENRLYDNPEYWEGEIDPSEMEMLSGQYKSYDYFGDESRVIRKESSSFSKVMNILTSIAFLVYFLFPVFMYIAVFRLSCVVPELKKVRNGALILLIISFILSPLLLTVFNLFEISLFPNVLSLVAYGIGLYLFLPPWAHCRRILAGTPQLDPEENMVYNYNNDDEVGYEATEVLEPEQEEGNFTEYYEGDGVNFEEEERKGLLSGKYRKYIWFALGIGAGVILFAVFMFFGNGFKTTESMESVEETLQESVDPEEDKAAEEARRNMLTYDLAFFNLRGPVKSFTFTTSSDNYDTYLAAISHQTNVKEFFFDEEGNWTNPISTTKRNTRGQIINIRTRIPSGEPDVNEFEWSGNFVSVWDYWEDADREIVSGNMKYKYDDEGKCISATTEQYAEMCVEKAKIVYNCEFDEYGNWIKRTVQKKGKTDCDFYTHHDINPFIGHLYTETRTIIYY